MVNEEIVKSYFRNQIVVGIFIPWYILPTLFIKGNKKELYVSNSPEINQY